MGFLFGNKKKEDRVLIFDIGSGSVGAAMVKISKEKDSLPIILNSTRVEIDYDKEKLNINVFIQNMLKALDQASDEIYHMKIGAPRKVLCVIAAPWYSSDSKIVKLEKNSSFVFNSEIADALLKKEIKNSWCLHNKKNKSIYNELEVIDSHIMNISLNGYQVDSPIGVRTKSVEMDMIISLSQKFFLDKIRKVISKNFHHTPVSFSSFIVASYFAIRNKYISPDSYLILDVGGEITEVGIVLKGVLRSSLSFPFGRKTFFRYISTKLEIDLREAKELFNLYNQGHLTSPKKEEVESVLKSVGNSWGESFRQSLSSLPRVLALPGTMFITTDNDIMNWLKDVIRNEEFIQSMTLQHKSTIITLKGVDFIKMCKPNNNFDCDPFLMIESIFIARNQLD